MSWKTIKTLRERRVGIADEMKALVMLAESEDRSLTDEESAKFDAMDADQAGMLARIETLERAHALDREFAGEPDGDKRAHERELGRPLAGEQTDAQIARDEKIRAEGFRAWLVGGTQNLTAEQRDVMRKFKSQETRAQNVGTDSEGGYLVPPGFVADFEMALLNHGGMRRAARILNTATGNDIEWPTANDTGNAGVLLAESTQVAEQDVVIGTLALNAYKYSSKLIRVSVELLQDSAFNLDSELAEMLGIRIARITNTHFTTGTGTAQPNGAVTASALGKTLASATAVTYAEIVDLEHSVDPDYRAQPGCGFMFNDTVFANIKKLLDGNNIPLWQPNVQAGAADTILGYPYWVNQDMPAPTSGLKSILFGQFQKYLIRDVRAVTVLRLVERYADFHQVGFVAFSRHDGDELDAGTNPIKHAIQGV